MERAYMLPVMILLGFVVLFLHIPALIMRTKHHASSHVNALRSPRAGNEARGSVSSLLSLCAKRVPLGLGPIRINDIDNDKQLKRIWIPGYPGSGSSMLREVTEALTGLEARDWLHPGCEDDTVITCKTHYPVNGYPPERVDPVRYHHDATETTVSSSKYSNVYFQLLRNPAKALPSWFNYVWEAKNNITSHTLQASIDDWRFHRDRHFQRSISEWVRIIKYWDEGPYNLALYLPYEELLNPDTAPALLKTMLHEIQSAQRRTSVVNEENQDIDETAIACTWKETVLDHHAQKRQKNYEPGFTIEQKDAMLEAIDDLIDWTTRKDNSDDTEKLLNEKLVDILSSYRQDIRDDLTIDDERPA